MQWTKCVPDCGLHKNEWHGKEAEASQDKDGRNTTHMSSERPQRRVEQHDKYIDFASRLSRVLYSLGPRKIICIADQPRRKRFC